MKSILVGLAIAAIVGPVSVLVIRIGLTQGMKPALVSAMGAAVADAAYGVSAAFGLLTIENLAAQKRFGGLGLDFWLPLMGGLFMLYLAAKIIRHPPDNVEIRDTGKQEAARGFIGGFASIFLLTISNPVTIISFIGIFAGLGITTGEKIMVVSGVFLGSVLWWVILSFITHTLRRYFNVGWLLWVNRLSAFILFCMAVSIMVGLAHDFQLLPPRTAPDLS